MDQELIIAIVYVDDAMFFRPDYKFVMKKKQEFMDKWECCDVGETKEFLHMSIKQNKNIVYLDQTADKVENEVDGLYVTLKNQHKTNTYFPSSLQVRASLKV
jgi:hypothetical protein